MLDSQERCKIGDFGLARSIGDADGNYHAQVTFFQQKKYKKIVIREESFL